MHLLFCAPTCKTQTEHSCKAWEIITSKPELEETTVQHETQNVSQPIISPNRGALPTPETPTNIIERGIKDPEFYAQNREAIAKAWRNRARNALRE